MTRAQFGYLGRYNKNWGYSPFEGFIVGGDGMSGYNFYGSEIISLRGYSNYSLTDVLYLSSVIALFAGLSLFAQDATASMPKFAYVDFNVLIQLMPEMPEARNTMEASSNEAQETYKGMVEEYQKKLEQYQQKAATWTAAIRESKEKELGELQNRISEFQEAIRQELQEQQQKLMAPSTRKPWMPSMNWPRPRVLPSCSTLLPSFTSIPPKAPI